MIEDVEINDNEFLRQFELEVEEQMARIEYALQDRKIFLTKFVSFITNCSAIINSYCMFSSSSFS